MTLVTGEIEIMDMIRTYIIPVILAGILLSCFSNLVKGGGKHWLLFGAGFFMMLTQNIIFGWEHFLFAMEPEYKKIVIPITSRFFSLGLGLILTGLLISNIRLIKNRDEESGAGGLYLTSHSPVVIEEGI